MDKFTVTFFTDLHHGDYNYNDFACTDALKKLTQIFDETQNSDFYINLGDAADYLKDSGTGFYEDLAEIFSGYDLPVCMSEGQGRRIYNSIGNHEAAYINKSGLQEFIPYSDDGGCTYAFAHGGILFLGVDLVYCRKSGRDTPDVIVTAREFTLPPRQFNYIEKLLVKKLDETIKGVVMFGHIPLKDVDETSKNQLLKVLCRLKLPVAIFEGHTHEEAYSRQVTENGEKIQVFTLPAVTSGDKCRYYTVTFGNGRVLNVEKVTALLKDK